MKLDILYRMLGAERARFEVTMLQFVQSELETGITFALLALDSRTDEKRERNRQNARKAYDTAKHFLQEGTAKGIVAQPELLERMTYLRNLLVRLGEMFEDATSS